MNEFRSSTHIRKQTKMKTIHARTLIATALISVLAVTAQAADLKIEKKQQDIRTMAQNTLQTLYKTDPEAKSVVEKAAGYAVFTNLGVKILVAGSGNGKGIAVDNKNMRETFMKMLELQAGFGMGVKKFQVVFVFDNAKAFNNFVNSGWQFGAQSTAAAKAGNKGAAMAGAVSVSDGVWMYQLTDTGLALEITAKSTKYYKDDDLN
jgi:lipid-binding SYLF domain-containing protein